MDIPIWVFLLIPFVIAYFWYVSIVGKRNKALEALSGIDVQLKQRADLIPNILTIAKKFMQHERQLLEKITALRTKVIEDYDKSDRSAVAEHLEASGELAGKMGQLMVNVENYPDLKSDQTMLQAQASYNEVEAKISAARRFYNSSVTELNNAVQIFPGNIIAGWANIAEMPFYEAEDAARQPVNAGDFLD